MPAPWKFGRQCRAAKSCKWYFQKKAVQSTKSAEAHKSLKKLVIH